MDIKIKDFLINKKTSKIYEVSDIQGINQDKFILINCSLALRRMIKKENIQDPITEVFKKSEILENFEIMVD